jgi:hypothetical protein
MYYGDTFRMGLIEDAQHSCETCYGYFPTNHGTRKLAESK